MVQQFLALLDDMVYISWGPTAYTTKYVNIILKVYKKKNPFNTNFSTFAQLTVLNS